MPEVAVGRARSNNAGVAAREMNNPNIEMDARPAETAGKTEDQMGGFVA